MPILVFGFGLIMGSFLNALIHRLASGESIFARSSKCPKCRHDLAWIDLIPVFSFFLLGRKCRYCKNPISWQYPIVELATAIMFILVYLTNVIPAKAGIQDSGSWILTSVRMTNLVDVIFQWIFVCFLIVIFVYDLRHYLILDKVVLPGAILAFLYQAYQGNLVSALISAVGLSGFFALLYFFSRGRWIGFGDVKLGIFLGLLVPWPSVIALFMIAYLSGAVVSLGLILAGKKQMSSRLPFGTFLTFAGFVAMLWGEEMMRWYFQLIGISV